MAESNFFEGFLIGGGKKKADRRGHADNEIAGKADASKQG